MFTCRDGIYSVAGWSCFIYITCDYLPNERKRRQKVSKLTSKCELMSRSMSVNNVRFLFSLWEALQNLPSSQSRVLQAVETLTPHVEASRPLDDMYQSARNGNIFAYIYVSIVFILWLFCHSNGLFCFRVCFRQLTQTTEYFAFDSLRQPVNAKCKVVCVSQQTQSAKQFVLATERKRGKCKHQSFLFYGVLQNSTAHRQEKNLKKLQ